MTARTAFWRLATIIRQDRIRVKRIERKPTEVRIFLRVDTSHAMAVIAEVLQGIALLQGSILAERNPHRRGRVRPEPFDHNHEPPQSPRTQ